MKQLLITITAVVLVGCATTQQPEPPIAKAPDISINQAIFDGNIEVTKQHMTGGLDVNAIDAGGWTPLHWAASKGCKKTIKLLLANGANINAIAATGRTPLDYTLLQNITETIDFLRKHGGKTSEELKAEGK